MVEDASRPVYLDCNATTPIDPRVAEIVIHYMREEFGNAGSRTHEYGANAKRAVAAAREQVGQVVAAQPDEVIFTSGATEANNLAILGLSGWAAREQKRHIVSTQIEHSAVLAPLEEMARQGFEVTLVPPESSGRVEAESILRALRPDTFLVSLMHVNNETGVIQPVDDVAQLLSGHPAYLHVDAAQGFAKDLSQLRNRRVDLISVSAHKIHGPKGIGALISRRRRYQRPPLRPLMYGGGQERGLRPGTQPVHQIVGFGMASELAEREHDARARACIAVRDSLVDALRTVPHHVNGCPELALPSVLNVSIRGVDSEAAILALRSQIAISNGSACTSHRYHRSHVLEAMGLEQARVDSALRLSWSAQTPPLQWPTILAPLMRAQPSLDWRKANLEP